MSGDGDRPPARLAHTGLNAHEDARAAIRLFQCSQCSYPLREPMTLPCGNSLCRPCLPPLFKRENITYPSTAGSSEGFICPFKDCGLDHSLGNCSLDVTLNKLIDGIRSYMAQYRVETSETPLLLDERLHWRNVVDSSNDPMPRSRVLHGGRLVATFTFAEMGELAYHSEVAYTPVNPESRQTIEALDVAVFETLKEATKSELECQVCYGLVLDPLTTSCGHTFCRNCVARVLDHSNLCPICRRRLPLALTVQGEPSNKRLLSLLQNLLPDLLAARMIAAQQEEATDDDARMPLFPCTLAYPMMPTFLHIFEPRYRLMVRRVMDNGSRKFGMMMYNRNRIPQGSLGPVQFMEYGTILHVDRLEVLADGRSLIQTRGGSRFRVLGTDMVDGYYIGRIQRVEDIPIAEEEAIEARESGGGESMETDDPTMQIERMSTQRLLDYGLEFITQARARSARWLQRGALEAYGQPPTDPATFPYWFASVLPITEEEKYTLLPTSSVRDRLKITVRWIQRLEAARCEIEAAQRALIARAATGNNPERAQQTSPAVDTPSSDESHSDVPDATDDPTARPEQTEPEN